MGKAVKHRSGPVRSVDNSRSTHATKAYGKDGGTKTTKGVRSSAPSTRGTGVGAPAGRRNSKNGTERGVTKVGSTIKL